MEFAATSCSLLFDGGEYYLIQKRGVSSTELREMEMELINSNFPQGNLIQVGVYLEFSSVGQWGDHEIWAPGTL